MSHPYLPHCVCPTCKAARIGISVKYHADGDVDDSASASDAEFLSLRDRDGPAATPAQIQFIQDLLVQTGEDVDSYLVVHCLGGSGELEDLTVGEASEVIEDLVEIRDEMRKDR
jgi:hypothetical protein